MHEIILIACFTLISKSASPIAANAISSNSLSSSEEEEFKDKLQTLLSRTDRSIKLLKEQINESQSAPFLPDLYIQLAELHSQRSSALYYIQMERAKNSSLPPDQQYSPVVTAQKEAIAVYQTILKDFPNYSKKRDVLFRLTTAYKSIDESIEFIKSAGVLIKEFPDSDDAMRTRLLLGQYYYDRLEFDEAQKMLEIVSTSNLVYESNLARYRIGLILIQKEQHAAALKEFETVIKNQNLREQDNPYDLSLKNRSKKSDLRREALIDSVRAYTFVYPDSSNPSSYYAQLAPNEIYYQEVIEKLALRYVTLKKFDTALTLLRALSERVSDPQRVVNTYQEVLVSIPPEKRIEIPLEEMRFVINKYSTWISNYNVPRDIYAKSYFFFEKQIRELGTTSHELAKKDMQPESKRKLLDRAQGFYELYLSFFNKTENSVKIAIDLADVHFLKEDFLRSGDLYLRIYNDEFGKSSHNDALLENAILALQNRDSQNFYNNVRMKGLLIKTLQTAISRSPQMKKDPKIHFLLYKTEYEQGLFPGVLDRLFEFSRIFPSSPQSVDAAELILDYFNSRSDYIGLEKWIDKVSSLKLPHPEFQEKLSSLRRAAQSKQLQEKVKLRSDFDEFSQGKSYLNIAASSSDKNLAEQALKEALAKSRAERDLQTFIEAATFLARKETDPQKKADVMKSIALEYIRMTRFYSGLTAYESMMVDTSISGREQTDAYNSLIRNLLIMRDWQTLAQAISKNSRLEISSTNQQRLVDVLSDLLDSEAAIPQELIEFYKKQPPSDAQLLSLLRSSKISLADKNLIRSRAKNFCASHKGSTCKWLSLEDLDNEFFNVLNLFAGAGTTLDQIEKVTPPFQDTLKKYQSLSGSGDIHIETIFLLREAELYRGFSDFLKKIAANNPDLASVLEQKSTEALANMTSSQNRCLQAKDQSSNLSPASQYCQKPARLPLSELLVYKTPSKPADPSRIDPSQQNILDLQSVFFFSNTSDSLIELARMYYESGHYFHSSAASQYGISLFKDKENDFLSILGCSSLALGQVNEASFHLKKSNDYRGFKTRCLSKIEGIKNQ